jgi:Ca2+-binding EF-hand superfamily protein
MHKSMTELGLDRNCPAVYQIINDLLDVPGRMSFEVFLKIVEDRIGDTKSRAGTDILFRYFDTDGKGKI